MALRFIEARACFRRILGALGLGLAAGAVVVSSIAWIAWMPGRARPAGASHLLTEDVRVAAALRKHVEFLSREIGARSVWADGLEASAEYIDGIASHYGYALKRYSYEISGTTVSNLLFELDGEAPRAGGREGEAEGKGSGEGAKDRAGGGAAAAAQAEAEEGMVLIGAHYDTVDESPGADDNASGVAVVLELMGKARSRPCPSTGASEEPRGLRPLRFVFFVNEEPPYFQTERMGSLVLARELERRGEKISSMISIESVGYYSDRTGSQSYPAGLGLLYPDRGDFIAFVGDLGSRGLVRHAIAAFRSTALLPSEGVSLPLWFPGVGWSDHWSFSIHGHPSIMVTDTALFRNPNYHEPSDVPETLDYDRMALLTRGLLSVVCSLREI